MASPRQADQTTHSRKNHSRSPQRQRQLEGSGGAMPRSSTAARECVVEARRIVQHFVSGTCSEADFCSVIERSSGHERWALLRVLKDMLGNAANSEEHCETMLLEESAKITSRFLVLQLLSQSAGTLFNEFSNSVAPSLAQILGFTFGNIIAFNSKSPSFMIAGRSHPVCVHAIDSLAHNALSTGRISIVVDPAKELSYNIGVDGPTGERAALTAYVPIPNHSDTSTFIAVLVLAHVLPPSPLAAAEARQKHVSAEIVELLKLVSVMLSAPLSRSIALQADEMRLSEYRAGSAFLTASNATRVAFDSNSTLFAVAEHLMSVFACDVVKIVSVSVKNTRDVVLHVTVAAGTSHSNRREVVAVKLCGVLGDVIHSKRELIDNRAIFNATFDKSCDLNNAPASCFNQLSRLLAVPILVDTIPPLLSEGQSSPARDCVGCIMLLRSEWNWDLDHVQHVQAVASTVAHLLPIALRE